jgi:hypothetical protein
VEVLAARATVELRYIAQARRVDTLHRCAGSRSLGRTSAGWIAFAWRTYSITSSLYKRASACGDVLLLLRAG